MWEPGFEVEDRCHGRLFGWHRSFCIDSILYRGTPEEPGLSLGLDLGGSCKGIALKIPTRNREEILANLSAREMPEEIYSCRPVKLFTGRGIISALTLTVNRDHRLYSPPIDVNLAAKRIASTKGIKGTNLEYLSKTVSLLKKEGITDRSLFALLDRVKQV